MKYYYLTADGRTAGPESLERLTALMAEGTVTVATMVVPAGGEDWTPLARVLKFFYTDATGATAGPVAFSELNRLNQTGVLAPDAWVLEEGGTEWKALSTVLAGGGVTPVAPAPLVSQLPRTATGAFVPGPVSAPATGTAPLVRRRRAAGGMQRGPFLICIGFIVFFFVGGVLLTARLGKMPLDGPASVNQIIDIFNRHFKVLALGGMVMLGAVLMAISQRIRNIGWPPLVQLLFFVPAAFLILMVFSEAPAWMASLFVIASLVGLIIFVPVSALPSGFARHRRLDSTAISIVLLLLVLFGGAATWGFMNKKTFEEEADKRHQKQNGKAIPAIAPVTAAITAHGY